MVSTRSVAGMNPYDLLHKPTDSAAMRFLPFTHGDLVKEHVPIYDYIIPVISGGAFPPLTKPADPTPDSRLRLEGDAVMTGQMIRLTNTDRFKGGAAWSKTKVPVSNGFTASFDFQITERGGMDGGGDGIWFALHNDKETGMLDPQDFNRLRLANGIAVEINTWQNRWDPDNCHIAILNAADAHPEWQDHRYALAVAPNLPQVLDGKPHHLQITYVPDQISVSLDGRVLAQSQVNLATLLKLDNGQAWVGLTAWTGNAYENHFVGNWTFQGIGGRLPASAQTPTTPAVPPTPPQPPVTPTLPTTHTPILPSIQSPAPPITPSPPAHSGYYLEGDTVIHGQTFRLTDAQNYKGGAVWSPTKQPVQNGFTTAFDFQVTNRGGSDGGGDGILFVIQNYSATASTDKNDYNRLHLHNGLAVELDMWRNDYDPDGYHIAVISCPGDHGQEWQDHRYALAVSPNHPEMIDGRVHRVTISYTPGILQVWLDGRFVVRAGVNLGTLVQLDQGRAWVGFAAWTGGAFENHFVGNWTYTGR